MHRNKRRAYSMTSSAVTGLSWVPRFAAVECRLETGSAYVQSCSEYVQSFRKVDIDFDRRPALPRL